MKLSTKIILPIILISALLILLAGCFGVPSDESPTITTTGTGTITGIIAAPCCYTLGEPVSGNSGSPEFWCYYCENDWYLQAGVKVILTSGQEVIATTTTDEFGVYTFTDVPPGENYVITAYCPDDDDIPLVKDVALELIEGGSFDAKTTDLVSTSLGLVVDFVVYFAAWDPEDISLDKVIAAKPHFPGFPKFKKLIREVRRVLENCEDVDEDDDLLEALCLAAEEVSESDMGCAPGFTPEPEVETTGGTATPDPDPDPDPDPTVSISLTKTVDEQCYTLEEGTLVYTLTVTNTGEVVLTNVTLTDGLLGIDESRGTLAVGASWTEVHDYDVPADQTETLTNTAEVSGNGGGQIVSATASVSLEACTILDYITVETDPSPLNLCAAGTGTTATETGTIITTAWYSDGTSAVVTPSLYDGYNIGVVSVDASGNVSSVGVGTTTITVHYEGETADVPVTVSDCTTLEEIEIMNFSPSPMDLCLNGTGSPDSGTITTMAYYNVGAPVDISTLATYTAVPTGVVSISGDVVTSIGLGSTTITATYQGKTAPITVTVNVTDCTTLESIEIVGFSPDPMDLCLSGTGSPSSGSIATMAYYSVGDPVNISTLATYTPDPTGVVSISGNVVTAIGVGSTTITATYQGKTAPITVTVNVTDCTTLESIEIVGFSPDPMDLCLSGTGSPSSGSIATMAYYSVGDPVNISTLATYTPDPTGVVSISGNVVTAIGVGSTTITATYQGKTAPITVMVTVNDCTPPCTSAKLLSLEIKTNHPPKNPKIYELTGAKLVQAATEQGYDLSLDKNVNHIWFTAIAECNSNDDTIIIYSYYRGVNCGSYWLVTDEHVGSGVEEPDDTVGLFVCKGKKEAPLSNILVIEVTNKNTTPVTTEKYTINIFRGYQSVSPDNT